MLKLIHSQFRRPILIGLLVLSYAVWLWIFKDFLLGTLPLYKDTYTHFGAFKYFYNNLFNGTVPLWEPFAYFGRPHIHSLTSGVLSPIALAVFSLHYIGLNYFVLYSLFLALYFLLGILGFYMLLRSLFKEDIYPLIGCWLLMFSGMGLMLFNQVNVLLLFVPSVWFFAFFFRFFENCRIKEFWGMVCSLSVVMVSYIPFYFITVLSIVLVIYLILGQDKWRKIALTGRFIKSHPNYVLSAIAVIMLAGLPLISFFVFQPKGETISPSRHACGVKIPLDSCPETMQMSFEEIAYGGGVFHERAPIVRIFSHLNQINFKDECVFYIPFFGFIFLFISIFSQFDRFKLMLLGTLLSVFWVSMGAATPLFRFLYDHVFYIKYFRNLFFYVAFLIPLIILFFISQLKAFFEQKSANKRTFLINVFIGHGLCLLLLIIQGNILPITYLVLFLSLCFFVLLSKGFFDSRATLFFISVFVLITLEPLVVFNSYKEKVVPYKEIYPSSHDFPHFEYVRPRHSGVTKEYLDNLYAGFYSNYQMVRNASFMDGPGNFSDQPDYIQKSVLDYWVSQTEKGLNVSVPYKIMIYDHIEPESFIFKDSDEFKVEKFDVNSLFVTTNFNKEKLLVYTDSFSSSWRVLVNGQEQKLVRASAFKGLVIPKGKNHVQFLYSPWGGQLIYVLSMMSMLFSFLLLFRIWWRNGDS